MQSLSDPTSAGEGCVAGLISSAGANMLYAFGASSSEVSSRHQEQNREGGKPKADNI